LEQRFNFKEAIASSFDNLNFVIESFYKATAFPEFKIIYNTKLILDKSFDKCVKTGNVSFFNACNPPIYFSHSILSIAVSIKYMSEF